MTRGRSALTVGIVRGERGQTATELLGMLLVVVVIIGALATSKAGAVIKTQSERIVCVIGGGSGCGAKAATTRGPGEAPLLAHAASGKPPKGPALGGHGRFTVLPFPGTSV